MEGWYKVHRSIIESPIFENANLLKVWIWVLSKTYHKDVKQLVGLQEITVKKGQFVFGRKKAAAELSINEQTVYRYIKALEKMGMIEQQTNSKFTIITVVKWGIYQEEKNKNEQQTEQPMYNNCTTNEQQMSTNKNVKNYKNEKKENGAPPEQIPDGYVAKRKF